jgi:hypothetical protein
MDMHSVGRKPHPRLAIRLILLRVSHFDFKRAYRDLVRFAVIAPAGT